MPVLATLSCLCLMGLREMRLVCAHARSSLSPPQLGGVQGFCPAHEGHSQGHMSRTQGWLLGHSIVALAQRFITSKTHSMVTIQQKVQRVSDLAFKPRLLCEMRNYDLLMLQCYGSVYQHRVCRYQDLILWNETLWYITTGPPFKPLMQRLGTQQSSPLHTQGTELDHQRWKNIAWPSRFSCTLQHHGYSNACETA